MEIGQTAQILGFSKNCLQIYAKEINATLVKIYIILCFKKINKFVPPINIIKPSINATI